MPAQYFCESLKNLLRDKLLHCLPHAGRQETPVPGLVLSRFDDNTAPEQCLYYPMVALVAQGTKRAFYGEHEISYGAGQYVVLCNDMPGVFHITEATPESPFLSLSIRLDIHIVISLLAEYPDIMDPASHTDAPIGMEWANEDMLTAFFRLLGLIGQPDRIPVFAPQIMREIHYYLLNGHIGKKLRMFCTPGTRDNRLARTISWLRRHFAEPVSMEALAVRANMAPSTFNRYFRKITSLSPLQFQKRLRLYEAQRLIVMEHKDARSAAEAVGYESESQFSREYKRLFGTPPMRRLAAKSS